MPLTHFVTGVGSSNLIYALTVVITFRNVLWPKVSSLYFQSWLFWVDLAQVWPKSGPIWSIQKLVRTGIMSVVLWECSWLSKICSDSKSRVSDVKNSRNIFTLFLPQPVLLNSSRNMCFNLRQTLKLSIASPQNNQFGWRSFLQSVTKDRSTSTYLIQVVRSIFETFSYYHIKPYYGPHSSLTLIPRVSKSSPKPGKIAEWSLR